jgi:tRNA pseudouridine13 synthase
LFNRLLAWRVEAGNRNLLQDGDLAQFDGSRSVFPVHRPDEEIRRRLAEGDIHPSGPLWGKGDPDSGGDTVSMESRLAIEYPELTSGLAARGMKQERRALRVIPKYLRWKAGADEITLEFFLPRGADATALLWELVDYTDIQAPLQTPQELVSGDACA